MYFRTAAIGRTLLCVNTYLRRAFLRAVVLGCFAPLASIAFAGCGALVVFEDETDSDTTISGQGGSVPLTCDVTAGPINLVPAPGNPSECRGGMSCEVWAGHGQHLSCPGFASSEPTFIECDIRDCLCTRYEEDDLVANFATGEVVDTRSDVTCRYVLVPSD